MENIGVWVCAAIPAFNLSGPESESRVTRPDGDSWSSWCCLFSVSYLHGPPQMPSHNVELVEEATLLPTVAAPLTFLPAMHKGSGCLHPWPVLVISRLPIPVVIIG